jgi:ATP-dependent RNA helicase DHX29
MVRRLLSSLARFQSSKFRDSGKSTQVPAFILEHQLSKGKPCMIYCTEPRRISAISLARRVSEELGERKNDLGTSRSLVGYAIRL